MTAVRDVLAGSDHAPGPEPDAGAAHVEARRPDPDPETGRHRAGGPVTWGSRDPARELLLSTLREHRRELRGLAGWSVLEAVPALVSGLAVAQAIDDGFLAGRPVTGLLWLAALAGSVLLGSVGTRQTLTRLAAVVEPFRDDLVRRVVGSSVRRPAPAGRAESGGDVARLTQHVEIVREAYAAVLMAVQQFVVVVLGVVIGLAALAPAVLPFVIVPITLALAAFSLVLRGMARRQRDSILADERLSDGAASVGTGMRDVVACGAEELVAADLNRHVGANATALGGLGWLTGASTLIIGLGGWLPVLLLLAAGPWLLGQGATTGLLLGAVAYTLQGVQPALQTLAEGLTGPGLWLMVTVRRVAETTTRPDPPVELARPDPARPVGTELHLEGVGFAYSPWAAPVVQELTLSIPPGDHLAVVGPSGIGKSTLTGLLTGLLRPDAGTVRFGGLELAGWDPAELARRRVLIPQEAYVFAGSLRENLTYLAPDADDATLDAAVDLLGGRLLMDRLGGYDALVDPEPLSSGERQLLTLVRAYVSPAPLVILDEATCHLGAAAEGVIERAFAARHGTLVVIAHRISSALRARRILVLDGTEARIGDHEALLLDSPLYRDLVGHWHRA